jgi:hypothetical protein
MTVERKMNSWRWRSLVRRFTRPRRDNLANLSEDIHRQAEEQEWDSEDNSDPPLMELNPSGCISLADAGSYVTVDNSAIQWSTTSTSPQATLSVTPMNDYTFALANGQEISISMVDDNNAIEITYNDEVIEPVFEDGKIILRPEEEWDNEENNAGQDTRAHEESAQDDPHGGQDMLQSGISIQYTQQ